MLRLEQEEEQEDSGGTGRARGRLSLAAEWQRRRDRELATDVEGVPPESAEDIGEQAVARRLRKLRWLGGCGGG